jgi:deoxyribodipyrimidine photo-lyase
VASPTLLWFQADLRLTDNPALEAALQRGGPIIPVFIWSPEEEGSWPPGAASRWWLHHSLAALDESLRKRGSRLILRRGASEPTLRSLIKETGAQAVYWNRRYEPELIRRDAQLKTALAQGPVEIKSFNSALLHEPWTVRNQSGKPFQVFTPFWRNCLSTQAAAEKAAPPPFPTATNQTGVKPRTWPQSLKLEELELEPRIPWASGFAGVWQPGEVGVQKALERFLQDARADYEENRNRPDLRGTSRLSPHLHFGEIGPRQIRQALAAAGLLSAEPVAAARSLPGGQFYAELGWREFAYHLLYHFPQTPQKPLREEFARFPWRANPAWLKAWQKGQTGYPLVDAGMRELWATGWMHNRVRMVVASFLVKHLLIPWSEGAKWFWDTLVDADLAANTLGWQWTSGCGADAAPYFRIFNPVSQGEKFDPQAAYVRRWVPEVARLPDSLIHQPWSASPSALASAGLVLGHNYPEPIVTHFSAREAALEAYSRFKNRA